MITLRRLVKRYGRTVAVDDLSVRVASGRVTGFLGPNGAGKSTTIRLLLGLDRPTSGAALIGGRGYGELRHPLRVVGALLDGPVAHPGRSARAHLRAMALSNGIPLSRVEEVLATAGLTEVADRRVGSYSLGMGRRLGIAAALLGEPPVLVFDEPVNGLDADGVRWMRQLMRSLAAEGRTVFVASHLLSEMQHTADHLVVIGQGRLIADAPTTDVLAASHQGTVTVRSPDAAGLRAQLTVAGMRVEQVSRQELAVVGGGLAQIGDIAHQCGARLHELSTREASLEQAYLELTADSVEYAAPSPTTPRTGSAEPPPEGLPRPAPPSGGPKQSPVPPTAGRGPTAPRREVGT